MSTIKVTHTDFALLHAKDFDQMADFYTNKLGLVQSQNYERIPGGEFESGNLTLQIIDHKAIGQEFKPSQVIAFRVDDVPAARAKLEAQGVEFLGDIIDSGVCKMTAFKDPSGNVLMIHHRHAPK